MTYDWGFFTVAVREDNLVAVEVPTPSFAVSPLEAATLALALMAAAEDVEPGVFYRAEANYKKTNLAA